MGNLSILQRGLLSGRSNTSAALASAARYQYGPAGRYQCALDGGVELLIFRRGEGLSHYIVRRIPAIRSATSRPVMSKMSHPAQMVQ